MKKWLWCLLFSASAMAQNLSIVPWASATPPTSCPGALPIYLIDPGFTGAGTLYGNTSPSTGTTCSALNTPGGGVASFTGDGTVFNNSASTGAVTATLATQSANTVLAGPASGSAAAPTFRSLVSADIPNNAANTTGNAATATALASTVSNIQGDLICAEAGDTSIDTNTVTNVAVSGSGPYTSVITVSSSLSTRYQIIGNNIGVTGATGGFALTSAAITAFNTSGKTITVSTATNPGTWSSGGTTFLACQNSANGTSNTPFLNNYTIPADYWSTTANLLVSFPLVLWSSSSPPSFQIALYDGGTVVLNQGGTVTPYASQSAKAWQVTAELYGMSASLVDAHTVGYMAYVNAQIYAYQIDNNTVQPVAVTGSSSETLQLEAVFGAATAGNAVWMPRMTTTILSY